MDPDFDKPKPAWTKDMHADCVRNFQEHHLLLWQNLSRSTGLLAMLNVSLFFLNGAVSCGGNYWPLKSLILVGATSVLMLLPFGSFRHLAFFAILFTLWLVAVGFFVASVHHWLSASGNSP